MLIMALAYQESGLDNNKKSHAGAVGIMQVKPGTAADRKIGIKNINLLENNIHAGVKYLAYLRDRYFSSEDIRERDRIRFALAAYNAGPARIQKIRNRAGKMGLDPNRWFRNTELAALKYIGQETVRYVSNINKYYLIFRFASDTEELRNSEKKKLAQQEERVLNLDMAVRQNNLRLLRQGNFLLPQEIADQTSQQRRLILFLPVGETAMTTSILFPQALQSRAEFFEPALAATSVFDFDFPDIIQSSFPLYEFEQKTRKSPVHIQ